MCSCKQDLLSFLTINVEIKKKKLSQLGSDHSVLYSVCGDSGNIYSIGAVVLSPIQALCRVLGR